MGKNSVFKRILSFVKQYKNILLYIGIYIIIVILIKSYFIWSYNCNNSLLLRWTELERVCWSIKYLWKSFFAAAILIWWVLLHINYTKKKN